MQGRGGQVGAGWLLAGVALIAALAWWHARETPEQTRLKRERAERAAAEIAEDARPALYRWRDANGVLQLTDQPPADRRYERIHTDTTPVAEIRGDRE